MKVCRQCGKLIAGAVFCSMTCYMTAKAGKHGSPLRNGDSWQDEVIELCPHCHCMTHTMGDGTCGKCTGEKKEARR